MFSMARRVLDDLDYHPRLNVYFKCNFDCPPSVADCSEECSLVIPASSPPPSVKYHMPAYFIFMLCLLGAAFVFLCYVTILKRYRLSLLMSRRTTPPPVEESREDFIDGDQTQPVDHPIWYIRTVGLPDSVIDSISIFKYKRGEGLTEGTDCSVCLTEFQEDETLRLLPKCSHAFHIPCIDTWLRSHKNCPMCRAPIVSETTNVVEQANNDVTVADQETQPESVVNNSENHQESEEVNPEIRPPVESIEAGNHKGIRAQSDLAEHRVNVDENENFQPPRRSVSMDSSSASMVYLSGAEIEAAKRNFEIGPSKPSSSSSSSSSASRSSRWYSAMKSSSFRRSLQKVPISMKRSSSASSGKCSLPITSSRSQDF